ncbi:MAG: hypothetical protein IT462_15345, partial [Planctomycetes bacterium]|nr:hypothetical protein [Planctomycetota bacterium]
TVTDDITVDTTWNFWISPITLDPAGTGGNIRVRNGATLTIDSSAGPVDILWNEDCDLQIGSASLSQLGYLVVSASSGAITFKIKTGGDVRIDQLGSINFSSAAATTTLTRFDGTNTWGSLTFEAGQTRQSGLKNCTFSYGGSALAGILVVGNSSTFVPTLENLSFDNCTTSAIRMDGYGLNVLKENNVTLPISVTNTTYVLYLNSVVSSAAMIRFPDVAAPNDPLVVIDGTCQVGDGAVSHWRFDDGYTFKVTAATIVRVTTGSIWGTAESRPTFEAETPFGFTDWAGLVDDSTNPNAFGDMGPFAFITVRNATVGFDLNKGTSYVPASGEQTAWRFPGLIARQCETGIHVQTFVDTSTSANAGYTTILDSSDVGGSTGGDECDVACVEVDYGRVVLDRCQVRGASNSGVGIGAGRASPTVSLTHDVTVRDSRITDAGGSAGIVLAPVNVSSQGRIEHCVVAGWTTGIVFPVIGASRSLTISHSFISASGSGTVTGFSIPLSSSGVANILVEDCTIGGVSGGTTNYGFRSVGLTSTATCVFRRTTFDGCGTNGAEIAGTGTCKYEFEECLFSSNGSGTGQQGGLRDGRGINNPTAIVQVRHCSFIGNNPYGAADANGNQPMVAEDCYWNSTAGADVDPDDGGDPSERVTTTVDVDPFLPRPYFHFWLGGSPASASTWDVRESSGADADNLHVQSNTPYLAWTFASDFAGDIQNYYHVQVSTDPLFGSTAYDTGKTFSTTTFAVNSSGLTDGGIYHARVRLWNQDDRTGPWRYLTFRLNTEPAAPGDSNRLPTNGGSADGDSTPQLIWERPTDADEDPLHFKIDLDTSNLFNTGNLRTINTAQSLGTNGAFEYSLDAGLTWYAVPADGVPAGPAILLRLTLPSTYPNSLGQLTNGDWYWRIRTNDGFEDSIAFSSPFSFSLTAGYSFSGTLTGSSPNSRTVILSRNGSTLGSTATSPSGAADFTFTGIAPSPDLVPGDILIFHLDDGAGLFGATLIQFTGQHFIPAGTTDFDRKVDIERDHVIVEQRLVAPITNANFATTNNGAMWTESSGAVTFHATNTDIVRVRGQWNITGNVTCSATSQIFNVAANGFAKVYSATSTVTLAVRTLDNLGSLDVLAGETLTVKANSTSSGVLRLINSTLSFDDTANRTLTVNAGILDARGATFSHTNGSFTGSVVVDSATDVTAEMKCVDSTFSRCGVVFETDGVNVAFDRNRFTTNINLRHIHWKCTDSRSVATMNGNQFDYAFGGSDVNVEAASNAIALNMVGCGGIRYGEGYDKNGGSEGDSLDNLVLWGMVPPKDVKLIVGEDRLRIEWTADGQADLSGAGYNIFRTTNPADVPPWGTALNGATPITNAFYIDTGLSSTTTYYYYVTCVDSNPTPDVQSGGSARVSGKPTAATIVLLSPASGKATSIVAMTLVGSKTHWETGNTSVGITGSGITINDTIILSPTLALSDLTLSGAAETARTVTTTTTVWGLYSEAPQSTFNVDPNPDLVTRPSMSFTAPSADGNTSGPNWTIGVSYSTNGGASINTSTIELMASRDVTVQSSNRPAGTNLSAIGAFWDATYPNSTTAICTVGQTAATELFANGEYTLYARVANSNGLYSEWVSRRFYVEGASASVAKTTTLLKQGDTGVNVSISGLSLDAGQAVDFNTGSTTGITVNSVSGGGTSLTVNVTVDQLADCGPRTFTVNNGAVTGIIVVEYPTNILPTTTNAEPSRNPAIGGVNVFLVNGAFFKSETDIATRGRMMGISWSRFYRSDIGYNGPLGNKWVGHYYQRAAFSGGNVLWYTPDGRTETFTANGGNFDAPAGVYVKATRETTHGTITLTDRHGFACVFNAQGRLWKCIDRNGNASVCMYNYAGQLTTITDDRAKTYNIIYHTHGRVSIVQDKVWSTVSPREVEYEYDFSGDLTEQKAPTTARYDGTFLPRITYGYRYDLAHRITACINPREFAQSTNPTAYMENQYENGKVIAQRLGEPDQWIYLRYDGSTVRVIDRRGLRTDYTLDSGRAVTVARFTAFWSVDTDEPISHTTVNQIADKVRNGNPTTDPDYFSTAFTYNTNHEILTVIYPRGNKVTYAYPASPSDPLAAGNVLTVTRSDESLGTLPDIVTQYTYEPNYQFVKTVTNPRGYVMTYAYDYEETADGADKAAGNLVTVTSPNIALGQSSTQSIVTRTTYNQYGQPVTSTDGEGNVSLIRYYTSGANDGFLNQTVTAAGVLDLTSEFAYDNVGNLTYSWPARAYESGSRDDNFMSSFEVNELDQTWHTTGPRLRLTGTDRMDAYRYFDANGNVTHTWREYVTDAGNEPSAPGDVNDPTSFTKSSSPMAATWVESNAVYNLLNYPAERVVDSAAGATVSRLTSRTVYDSNYNVLQSISPLGNRSAMVYDERDMFFQGIVGDYSDVRAVFQSDYDANGNLAVSRDALGNATAYTYDGFDRTTRVTDAAGHYRTSAYDANSNVTESGAYAVSGGAPLAYSYSYFDEIDRAYASHRLALDHRGEPIGDGHASNATLFDRNSRVVSSVDDNGVVNYRFYDAANRTDYVRDNVGNEIHFRFNADSAVTRTEFREVNGLTNAQEISHDETDYDFLNRRLKYRDQRYNVSTRNTEVERKYDGWGRVTQTTDAANTTTDMTFDLLSRNVRTLRKPDPMDATRDIVTDMAYDDDSRVIRRSICEDPTVFMVWQDTDYTYDERSRIVTLRRPDGDIWNYFYDGNSNRLGWQDPLGTRVTDTFDSRNLISSRQIERGTGIKGATSESYDFDALGRLTSCSNYDGERLLTSSAYAYGTLGWAETLDQVMTHSDGVVHASTTGAEYDATGFCTATIYEDGHTLRHHPDALNRLGSTVDETDDKLIAAYIYAGANRLVQRVLGNGVVTRYDYEASGCGCGGFSGLCERVEHSRDGDVLAASDRRYDVVANVTVERREHFGNQGNVYRYDRAYRLTSTFNSVDLSGTNLATYADPSATPTGFAVKRAYNLDTRGNRSGSSAVSETDDLSNTIYNTAFNVSTDKNNLYSSIDGNAFAYDAAEQMTFDPSTGLYHAYDYKGQLILTDDDINFPSPERKYAYDNFGRLKVEERWTNTEPEKETVTNTCHCPNCVPCPCGGGSPPEGTAETEGGGGEGIINTFPVPGNDGAVPPTPPAQNPAQATFMPPGAPPANSTIAERVEDFIKQTFGTIFLLRNQLGSVMSKVDEQGAVLQVLDTDENGTPHDYPVARDLARDEITNVQANTPVSGQTTITVSPTLIANALTGLEFNVSTPTGIQLGRILSNTTAAIIITDVGSAVANALGAGNPASYHALVYGFAEASTSVNGTVTSTPSYSSTTNLTQFPCADPGSYTDAEIGKWVSFDGGPWLQIVDVSGDNIYVAGDFSGVAVINSTADINPHPNSTGGQLASLTFTSGGGEIPDFTTLTAAGGAVFGAYMLGWQLQLNPKQPATRTITAVSGNTLSFNGNGVNLATTGDFFRVFAPPGVQSDANGTNWRDQASDMRYCSSTGFGWAGYRYLAPVAGFVADHPGSGFGIHGRQGASINLVGSYYCWNRIYSPYFGRWTTPDPLSSPWWNLWDYCGTSPTGMSDSLGLEPPEGTGQPGEVPPGEKEEKPADDESTDDMSAAIKRLRKNKFGETWWDKDPIKKCPCPEKLANAVLYESANTKASLDYGNLEESGKVIGTTGSTERKKVASVDDIISALTDIVGKTEGKDCKCKCIQNLTFVVHSNSAGIIFFGLKDTIRAEYSAFRLGQLIAGALCEGGTVNFMSCHLAEANFLKYFSWGAGSATTRGVKGVIEWEVTSDEKTKKITGTEWKLTGDKPEVREVKYRGQKKGEKGNKVNDWKDEVYPTGKDRSKNNVWD